MSNAYQALEQRFARMSAVSGAMAVLNWDRATMMPDGGADARSRQLSTLSVIRHELLTAPDMADLLTEAEAKNDALNGWQSTNLVEMRRRHAHAVAVPARLVEQLSQASSECEMTWRRARADDDFAALAPQLDHLLSLVRESGERRGAALGLSTYDALIDQFDPGGSQARIEPLFDELSAFLPAMLREIMERQASGGAQSEIDGYFPVDKQEKFAREIMKILGFDFSHGRLDTSHHPFTGGVPEDSRITTRYDESDFTSGLMAVIHETGHSQYERGLPQGWLEQPVGQARGMTMHESQSLLFEMQAARSPQFIAYLADRIADTFGLGELDAAGLQRTCHRVRPGIIRVDADEVTYPLHIILRYRLERQLIGGTMKVADLPEAWRTGMQELLGIAPETDADGCMQDIHWPSGAFGYFPSYTLGALAAAQIFAAAGQQVPDITTSIGDGNFAPLNGWLRTNIHGLASRHSTDEILERATGAPLGVSAFRAHLSARYLSS